MLLHLSSKKEAWLFPHRHVMRFWLKRSFHCSVACYLTSWKTTSRSRWASFIWTDPFPCPMLQSIIAVHVYSLCTRRRWRSASYSSRMSGFIECWMWGPVHSLAFALKLFICISNMLLDVHMWVLNAWQAKTVYAFFVLILRTLLQQQLSLVYCYCFHFHA